MTDLPLELDHVGVVMSDLDVGRDAYEKLGFTLTSRSIHSGSREPGGPVEPWGSGNHCAMFEKGYFEVMGLTDPNLYSSALAMVERYEGAHIVAIGAGETVNAHGVLSGRFDGVSPARRLERDAAFGPNDEETRRAAFNNIHVEPEAFPEAKLIFIEHETRDVLWQPHLMSHPNGAVATAEVALCVADTAETCGRFSNLLAMEPKAPMPGVSVFGLDHGNVYVLNEASLEGWTPGIKPPCVPYVSAVGFTVKDLSATKTLLGGNGVPFTDHKYPAIWIAPEYTCGPVVSFIQG
jgi:hypothetical protein